MPVTCLNSADKLAICTLYVKTKQTQASLGKMYGVATSTIHAVLNEAELTSRYIKRDVKPSMKKPVSEDRLMLRLLKNENIDLETLTDILSLWNPKMFEAAPKNKELA